MINNNDSYVNSSHLLHNLIIDIDRDEFVKSICSQYNIYHTITFDKWQYILKFCYVDYYNDIEINSPLISELLDEDDNLREYLYVSLKRLYPGITFF